MHFAHGNSMSPVVYLEYRTCNVEIVTICLCDFFPNKFKFSLQSDSHQTFIRRTTGTRYLQDTIIDRHRYGGAGFLVRGWIKFGSRTYLNVQIGTMVSQMYPDIILKLCTLVWECCECRICVYG
ncbi:transposable element Tcb1 transposase [Trichonephila clavipes]|nr:transposable element Tcb1 transposase [Trichonephila clavipes]